MVFRHGAHGQSQENPTNIPFVFYYLIVLRGIYHQPRMAHLLSPSDVVDGLCGLRTPGSYPGSVLPGHFTHPSYPRPCPAPEGAPL